MKEDSVTALRQRWDQRAWQDAMYFIAAERQTWTDQEFLASGEENVTHLVDPVLPLLHVPVAQAVALDIGCGLGRLARPLARRFRQVLAIDISPVMIEKANSFAPPLPTNIDFQVCDGSGAIPASANSIDFVFSYIVFQHLPTLQILERYFAEIARVMTPGALAYLQVNTHRRSLSKRFQLRIVPSDKVPLLKRKLKMKLDPHSTMGVVLSPAQCRQLVHKHQLLLEQTEGMGTQYTWLTLRKPVGAG